jgi:ribulose-5-phosphate 4-epimerase/fuculose-1-phosphate aldolase
MQTELDARQELSNLYAAIAHYKWDDLIYTHASIRVPGTSAFLINRFGMLFNEVTADNLIRVEVDLERPDSINAAGHNIHSAIYRARPEVNCIVHTHTKEGVAVSASAEGLVPISQYACGVIGSLAYHDYQGIVVDQNEEQSLCLDLGSKNHMILRNHGLLTVGVDVPQAFFNMYNLQKSCEIQVLTASADRVLISKDVLKTVPLRQAQFNQPVPHRPLAWAALKRLICCV